MFVCDEGFDLMHSIPLVFAIPIKSNEVEHFPHPAPNPAAVQVFDFCGTKISSDVSKHFALNKKVVTAE
jgi:hypothetical protein